MNAITTTSAAEEFRAKSAAVLSASATMSLHQLVDEFQRLTDIVDAGHSEAEDGSVALSDAAKVAQRERSIIVGASKARFGISFETYDRREDRHDRW